MCRYHAIAFNVVSLLLPCNVGLKGADSVSAGWRRRTSADARFLLDGDELRGNHTPFNLEMEDGDVIEVHYTCHKCVSMIECECGRHGGLEASMYHCKDVNQNN